MSDPDPRTAELQVAEFEPGETFRVDRDRAGHPFCLVQPE